MRLLLTIYTLDCTQWPNASVLFIYEWYCAKRAAFLLITYNAVFLRVFLWDYPRKEGIKYAKQIHSLNLCSILEQPWEEHFQSCLQLLNVQKRNINKSSLRGDTINLDAFDFNWHRYSHLLHENISVHIEHVIIFIYSLIAN